MRFARPRTTPLKLTTAAAMQVAPRATRNLVDLDAEQIDPFFRRETFTLHGAQCESASHGHVLVRHAGHGLGVGFYRPASRTLESLFPKGWVGWVG
jgi:NOL1/NOP2/fmu family ribosome biogenesis protein